MQFPSCQRSRGIREMYGSLLGRAIADISQSACLLLVAAALFVQRQKVRSHEKPPSAVIIGLILAPALVVAGISVGDPNSEASVFSAAILATVALCCLAASWVAFTARTARAYVAVFLLIYAADYYSPFGMPAEGSFGSAVHSAVLLLVFIVLGYMCAFVLREEAVRSAPGRVRRQPASSSATRPAEPVSAEPEVTVTLQNQYALLYLWGKKSGRLALAAMVGLVFTVVVAVITALPKLLTLRDAVK